MRAAGRRSQEYVKHKCVLFMVSPDLLQCMDRILDPTNDWVDDVPGVGIRQRMPAETPPVQRGVLRT